jgi:hypothetical protein
MFSLQKCRELLGNDSTLSNEALELLRDQLYALADIATTEFIEVRRKSRFENPGECRPNQPAIAAASVKVEEAREFEEFVSPFPVDEREELEERAAVLEFDAGMARYQAERVVMIEHWRNRNRMEG